MSLRAAAEIAVSVLGDEPRYAALRASALRLADVVDANDGNASLWREYLNVLRDVMEAAHEGDDSFEAFMDSFTEVGDAPD